MPEDTKLRGHHNIFRRLIVSENHTAVFHGSSFSDRRIPANIHKVFSWFHSVLSVNTRIVSSNRLRPLRCT